MSTVDQRLKELRKEKKLTQVGLQMATDIDQSLLSKYKRGEQLPTTDALIILADFYHVSIDYLLGRSDVK